MKNLLALLFLSLTACGVVMADDAESIEEPTQIVPMQQSYAVTSKLEQSPIQSGGCYQSAECWSCGTFRTMNVIAEYCPGEEPRLISWGPCSQECF